MKHKTWAVATLAGVALVAVLSWAFAPRPVEVELAPVVQGTFEITVDEYGKTRLAERYTVSAPLAGRLARITLREGDEVQAGSGVATLAPVLPSLLDDRARRELRARDAAAQDNLERAAARRERAQLAHAQAGVELRRSEQLARQGFIAPTRLDADRLAAQVAQRELEAADAEWRMAGHEREQAQAALAPLQPGAGAAAPAVVLRAPVAGRVLRVLQASEGAVAPGTPLLELGDTGRLEIVAELLTSDALAAWPGRAVRIDRWGGPAELAGRVRAVEPSAFTKVSALGVEEQRVRVLIDLTSPREAWQALGDGYRVGLRIVTLTQADVLQVPVSAVFPLPSGALPREGPAEDAGVALATQAALAGPPPTHAVFAFDGRRARLVTVALGGRNGRMAWIRGGLAAGQTVIVYPPAGVRDGIRVAPRQV